MLSRYDRRLLFWGVMIGMLVLDQAVKAWARGYAGHIGDFGGRPWPNVFEVTLTFNEGIAFGMFSGHGVLLAPIAIGMSCAAIWYALRHPKESVLIHLAMGLLAAGALGNLIDRLALHRVTDMFWFRLINFPVFNVADACITVAAFLLIGTWSLDSIKKDRPQAEKAKPAADTPVT